MMILRRRRARVQGAYARGRIARAREPFLATSTLSSRVDANQVTNTKTTHRTPHKQAHRIVSKERKLSEGEPQKDRRPISADQCFSCSSSQPPARPYHARRCHRGWRFHAWALLQVLRESESHTMHHAQFTAARAKGSSPCESFARRRLLVVVTAHTPCRSAAEVSAVIAAAKPDVVVLELDQERLEGLLREDSTQQNYGADFAAAANAAVGVGAPIILGDVKARRTIASLRAPGPIADTSRITRAARLALRRVATTDDALRVQPVSIVGSLIDDPGKLLPLLAGLWWTILLSAIATSATPAAAASTAGTPADLAVAGASTLLGAAVLALGARVYDVLLLSRDEALAASALRGLELARSLRSGALLRQRYTFGTDPHALAAAPAHPEGTLPLFTLRRPLRRGEVRKLNLFEPRWLNLLDRLAVANADDAAAHAPGGEAARFAASEPSRLVNASLGCVFAVNRYYAPAQPGADEAEGGGAARERVADVVLRPIARRARIVRAELSRRPVSGDRRLEVWLCGEEPLRIDAPTLAPTGGGYLAARVTAGCEEDHEQLATAARDAPDADGSGVREGGPAVRVVSVVGLAHANGVLDRCSASALRDASALASVGPADEPDWVGY